VSAHDLAIDVLLVLAAFGEAVCWIGLVAARTALDKLHYAGAATTLPPFLIAAAVVVEEGGTQPSLNAIVTAVLVLVLGAALNHFTARVAHIRNRERRS
jgi:multisubunit Na+/H+ antiporter MnhG subunit